MIVRDENGRMAATHTIIRVSRTSHFALRSESEGDHRGGMHLYIPHRGDRAILELRDSGHADCGAGTGTAGFTHGRMSSRPSRGRARAGVTDADRVRDCRG